MSNPSRPSVRQGRVPRSIVLPAGPIEPTYAPDGLSEADIDALIAETTGEDDQGRPRPGWVSADVAETRRARHKTRQVLRALPSTVGKPAENTESVTAEYWNEVA